MKLTFAVPGKVRGKQRPKFARVGNFVRTYTPEQTVNYENWVKTCFMEAYPNWKPTEKPLIVGIRAFFVRPKTNKEYHPTTVRLDCDNVAKAVCDSLNGIAYKDDKQIIGLTVGKLWGEIETVLVDIELVDIPEQTKQHIKRTKTAK